MRAGQSRGGPRRRFRRRLLVLMLTVGLIPSLVWGALADLATRRFLSVSFAPLESLLDDLDGELDRRGGDPALRDELRQARLNLAQAELARRSLGRLVPWALAAVLAASGAVLLIAAAALARSVSGPIEKLTEGMTRYGQGELGHQIPERAGGAADELELLVRQFNRMGRELEAQRQRLRVAEALGAWQEVARVLAHELKNPLTAMRMALARLARSSAWPDGSAESEPEAGVRRRESLALLEEELDALLRMTQSFSDLAKLPPPSPRPVELGTILGEVCGLYRDASPVPIECAAAAVTVHADPDLLRRAFGNLVKNAVEASRPGDGPIRVDLERDGGQLRVVVSDHGVGVPAPLDGVALARSQGSTKPQGSGLGLPIAQKILHEHGGSLRLEPGPSGGTRAVADLPVA